MTRQKDIERLEEQFEKQKKNLLSTDIFWKGSITKRWMTCGNSNCRCNTDKKHRHGPYYYWTTKKKGRSEAVLLPKESVAEAKIYLQNYKELNRNLKALFQLSEKIIRKKLKPQRKTPKPKS